MSLVNDPDLGTGADAAPVFAGTGQGRTWRVAVWIVAVLAALPLVVLALVAIFPVEADEGTSPWLHLIGTVLPGATVTTFLLMAGIGCLTAAIGVTTAWIVATCRFPGRGFLEWALLLPLAIPTYIVAYAHVEVLDFTGPVQSAIRWLFGFKSAKDYWFPNPRSLPSAIFVMSLVLYPYVYMTTRAMFALQSAATIDVARTLGAGPWRVFFRVALPLARPALAVGVTLSLMECLNDIGAVEYLGVKTLTFSVYDTWLNRGSLSGAAQIACLMLAVVFLLVWAERHARRHQRFSHAASRNRPMAGYRLSGSHAALAFAACALPVLLGFVVPVSVLADYASRRLEVLTDPGLIRAARNSLVFAAAAAALTVGIGLVLAYAVRLNPTRTVRALARASSVGYAVPGAVLAVGILLPLTYLDNRLNEATALIFGTGAGLVLVSSGVGLIYAYVVRFLAVSIGSIESGLSKISLHLDMAARTLGRTAEQSLVEIHLPLLRPVLVSAGLLVFVDAMKELPATLLLRPFNVETLATWVYVQASREAIGDAAPAALAIVLVGLLPLLVLSRIGRTAERHGARWRAAAAAEGNA
ncbi:ABC transporter permease [Prosthecodimorpha staleyi]|uniref:Iron ABC transporter permease n=1 Tax=Prosthecodimorpha staleyi TaxID=2840188 RepID=A0A947D6X6_9HYPH|nr:iron ABC transporter permease [Prosthecodimorpha staleyi]MBT9290681.1 iron ABC transporter permease [Prosthecodimorpha staleyi]